MLGDLGYYADFSLHQNLLGIKIFSNIFDPYSYDFAKLTQAREFRNLE